MLVSEINAGRRLSGRIILSPEMAMCRAVWLATAPVSVFDRRHGGEEMPPAKIARASPLLKGSLSDGILEDSVYKARSRRWLLQKTSPQKPTPSADLEDNNPEPPDRYLWAKDTVKPQNA